MPIFVDTDECQGTSHGCIQICTNTVGSYMCGCQTGFQLDGDGRQCNGELNDLECPYEMYKGKYYDIMFHYIHRYQ